MADSKQSNGQAEVEVPNMVYFTRTVHHKPYDKISPLRPELSAAGKNVIVTGGGTGIGKAIAVAFARAGAKSVSIIGRRPDRLEAAIAEVEKASENKGATLITESADLMKRAEVDAAFQSISGRVGKIDILVSNAGVLPDLAPIVGYDADEFMRGFRVNVLSAFNAVQAFVPLAGDKPMILNISSCIAHMAPIPYVSGYATSKAANLKMMEHVAAENPNLFVVNVQPGNVPTEMSDKAGVEGEDARKFTYLWQMLPRFQTASWI